MPGHTPWYFLSRINPRAHALNSEQIASCLDLITHGWGLVPCTDSLLFGTAAVPALLCLKIRVLSPGHQYGTGV